MPPVYEKVLELQNVDLSLRVHQNKKAKHALVLAVQGCETELLTTNASLTSIDEEVKQKNKSFASLERDVADIASKLQRSRDTLASGSIVSAKAVASMETEIAFSSDKCSVIEDEQLEVMEQLEALAVQKNLLEQAVEAQTQKLERLQEERNVALSVIDDEMASLEETRKGLSVEIMPKLLTRYESLRAQFDGLVLARLDKGVCEGCHMRLSSHAIDQFKNMSEDDELLCEECGRILVA